MFKCYENNKIDKLESPIHIFISFRKGKTMIESRPKFDKITSFDEFNKYYWYREELSQICKLLGLEYRGTKQELTYIIEQYFKGDVIKK